MHKLPNKLAAGTKLNVAPTRNPNEQPVNTPPNPHRMNKRKLINVGFIAKHQNMMKLRIKG
jgi:hypothetical protein